MWNPFTRHLPEPDVPPKQIVPPERGDDAETAQPEPGDRIAEIEVIGPTAVATLTVTELTQKTGAEQLAGLLNELAETGAQNFVLDVQNVQYMDTTCLGCLVKALNDLADRGGCIALANPNHSVHYVFRLTRLDRVFRICPNVLAAMDAVDAAEGRRQAG